MTKIINQLIAQVAGKAALAKSLDIVVGRYWTLVILADKDGTRAGLSTTLDDPASHHHGGSQPVTDAGKLLSYPVTSLLNLMLSNRLTEVSIGFATLNALLEVDDGLCQDLNAYDLIFERGTGRNIAVVGHFPFVPRLKQVAKTLWVLERNPQGDDLEASEASRVLPQTDVVAITGTSLANGTFEDLLALCRPDTFVVVLGATTPLSPVLLDAGVSAVAGTIVVDPETVRKAVSQGATFRQIKGKHLVTMMRRELK